MFKGKKIMKYVWEKFRIEEHWRETGMLEGCSGEQREILVSAFNELADIIIEKNLPTGHVSDVTNYLFPIARQIFSILEKSKDKEYSGDYSYIFSLNKNKNLIPIVKKKINLKEVVENFVEYHKVFLPICEKYLSNIDSQAEMISIFCYNYVMGKTEEVLKQNKEKNV